MLKIKTKRKKKSMNFQSLFLGETIKTTAMSGKIRKCITK